VSLEIHDLSVRYGTFQALDGVSLGVRSGELLGVIGPNGSGKSSLARAIAGMQAHSGRITLGATAARVGYMPQDISGRAALTVLEVVLLGRLRRLGLSVTPEHLAAVEAVLSELDLNHLAHRNLSDLSGGQRQLVFLAQALASDPTILLLDEPTSALDIRHQLEVLSIIARLTRERSLASIVILHDLNAAARYCDRIAALDRGRLAAVGAPGAVLTPALLGRVFGVEAIVATDPSGAVMVSPVRALARHCPGETPQNGGNGEPSARCSAV